MDLRRIWILMGKEVRLGAASFLSIYVLVMPVVLSLLISLVFGDLFAGTPRLGIFDPGGNEPFIQTFEDHPSINTRFFASDTDLENAVARGAVEVGLSLSEGFADSLQSGSDTAALTIYKWGEAGVRSLLLLEAVFSKAAAEASGFAFDELPVSVEEIQLGKANTATWSQRLLPLILIMAIVLSGLFVPASSLVDEKQKGTLTALTATPASLLDVYLAKTFFGVILSSVMAVVILTLNASLSGQAGLLLLVIILSGLLSSVTGVILGSASRDMETFMGIIKALGLVLYAPGLLRIFPQVPDWIGRIFPTYYIMNPLIEITQNAAGFADVALDLGILAACVAALLFALSRVIRMQQERLALEG